MSMKIAVLIKQVPDTWGERKLNRDTGRVDRSDGDQVIDEIDERALEVALSYRDRTRGTEVVAVSMGPASAAGALRKALSLGADSAVHLLDDGLAGADAGVTSLAIASTLKSGDFDLVVAGNVSTDGGSGVVPAMIAEHLGWAQLSSMDSLEISERNVSGVRTSGAGKQHVRAELPLVLTVTERLPEARFPSFKNIMTAKRKPLSTVKLSDIRAGLAIDVAANSAGSVVVRVVERPVRGPGLIVVDDGTAAEQLADFLAAEHLI